MQWEGGGGLNRKAFTIGDPDGEYKAPFAVLFRAMALIAVEGTNYLPRYSVLVRASSSSSPLTHPSIYFL